MKPAPMPSLRSPTGACTWPRGVVETGWCRRAEPMRPVERLRSLAHRLRAVRPLLPHLRELSSRASVNAATLLERNAREHGHAPALLFEDETYSWAELNRHANRWARLLLSEGIVRRDVI